MTTAPTAAQADAIADTLNIAQSLFINAAQGSSLMHFVVSFTQNDATINGLQLPADPTADLMSAAICRGLAASYANVTVREYLCNVASFPSSVSDSPGGSFTPSANFLAGSTEQARVNNPANWLAAP